MARIPMTSGFQLIPEGEYVFRVYDATYDETFGKIEVFLVNAQGQTLTERFSIMSNDGTMNEKAQNAFSYFAKTVMNDFNMEDVDVDELVNHYIRAEVVHNQSTTPNKNGKYNTFANLGNKSPADGFDTEPCEKAKTLCRADRLAFAAKREAKKATSTPASTSKPTTPQKGLNLDDLLG